MAELIVNTSGKLKMTLNTNLIITPDDYEKLIQGDVVEKMYDSAIHKYRIMFSQELLDKLSGKKEEV